MIWRAAYRVCYVPGLEFDEAELNLAEMLYGAPDMSTGEAEYGVEVLLCAAASFEALLEARIARSA